MGYWMQRNAIVCTIAEALEKFEMRSNYKQYEIGKLLCVLLIYWRKTMKG